MSEPEQKQGLLSRIRQRISRTPRMQESWKRMHREGGFIPIFNTDDVEIRRREIYDTMEEIKGEMLDADTPEKRLRVKEKSALRIYSLFFTTGSPWYRGLDDRELAKKAQAFLELYEYVNDIGGGFIDDLFMCGMQLLNLSWKALDVTNVPPYIIETHTTITEQPKRVQLKEEVQEY